MTQPEKSSKKSFREFRVDSICSTSNPDAFINESGLDDFVAGKASDAATGQAKKAGGAVKAKIDPTKAGQKKRLVKKDKIEAKNEIYNDSSI